MIPTINNPFDDYEFTLQSEVTTATLSQYYEELEQEWEIGTQEVSLDGTIVSREYSLLSFPNNPNSKLIKVPLGAFDQEWQADFYYVVSNYFTETSYSSDALSTEELPFLEWQKRTTDFRLDSLYRHRLISVLNYFDNDAGNRVATINVGKALGAVINYTVYQDDNGQDINSLTIKLKESLNDPGTTPLIEQGPTADSITILLNKPLLELSFRDFIPNGFEVEFYGEYAYKSFAPSFLSTEDNAVTLTHPITASYQERLKPPGLPGLPDNFWNTGYNNLPTYFAANRTNSPQWI